MSLIYLFLLGCVSGVINVLAGGGSNLTLPALMIFGLPPEIANATNRLGVFCQNLVGVRGFLQKGRVPLNDLRGILIPIVSGGLLGALGASYAPPELLKTALLGTMLTISGIMLFMPQVVFVENEQPRQVKNMPQAWFWLFFAGVYGGFVQAGVGFVLITAIAGCLRYDLIATNALKLLASLIFTTVALIVFIARGQVEWVVGLALATGNMMGAHWGVRFAFKLSARFMKIILFSMTLAAVTAAYFN